MSNTQVLADQTTAMPTRKLAIGSAGAAILAPHLITVADMAGIVLPTEVAMWLAIGVTLAWGYMTKERAQ